MPDQTVKIRARLDAWKKQKAVGAEGYFDGIGYYMQHFESDLAFLLAENEALREQIVFLRDDMLVEREHSEFLAACLHNRNAEVQRLRKDANDAE